MRLPLVGAALLALSLSFPVFSAPPGSPPDEFIERAEELAQWIADNSDFEPMPYHPAYIFLPEETIHYVYYEASGIGYDGQKGWIVAMYTNGMMFLPDTTDLSREYDQSVLLHELVHHFQFIEDREYDCPAASEKAAYDIEDKWRKERGMPPALSPATYYFVTTCPEAWR